MRRDIGCGGRQHRLKGVGLGLSTVGSMVIDSTREWAGWAHIYIPDIVQCYARAIMRECSMVEIHKRVLAKGIYKGTAKLQLHLIVIVQSSIL